MRRNQSKKNTWRKRICTYSTATYCTALSSSLNESYLLVEDIDGHDAQRVSGLHAARRTETPQGALGHLRKDQIKRIIPPSVRAFKDVPKGSGAVGQERATEIPVYEKDVDNDVNQVKSICSDQFGSPPVLMVEPVAEVDVNITIFVIACLAKYVHVVQSEQNSLDSTILTRDIQLIMSGTTVPTYLLILYIQSESGKSLYECVSLHI